MLVIEGLSCILDLIEPSHYLAKVKLDGNSKDYSSMNRGVFVPADAAMRSRRG